MTTRMRIDKLVISFDERKRFAEEQDMEEQRIKKDLDWGNIGFAYHETDMRMWPTIKTGHGTREG